MGELVLELAGVWKGFERGSQRVPVLEDVLLEQFHKDVLLCRVCGRCRL